MARVSARVENAEVIVLNLKAVQSELHFRASRGVNLTLEKAFDTARDLVPVRKTFRYGRNKLGSRVQGRQDTRTLSLEEALSESVMRRRMGLPSAFPTDAAGRRIRGSQATVRTAQLSDTYRSFNRANRGTNADMARREVVTSAGKNRLGTLVPIFETRFRGLGGGVSEEEIGHRFKVNTEAESDLSARGRYELAHQGEPGRSIGGALKKSVKQHPAAVGRRMTAYLTAGGGDVDYAKYVEFGTRRSRAQPFMRPALAQAREVYLGNLKKSMAGEVT